MGPAHSLSSADEIYCRAARLERPMRAFAAFVLVFVLVLVTGCGGSQGPRAAGPPPAAPRPPAWLVPGRAARVVARDDPEPRRASGFAVIDLAANRIFLPGADGHVCARELRTGAVVFDSAEVGAPFALLPGGALAVYAADERVVLLDRDDGTRLFASDPIALPDVDALVRVALVHGALELAWSRTTSPGLACCNGGTPTTTRGGETIALDSGVVTEHERTTSEGMGPFAHVEPPPDDVVLAVTLGTPDWTRGSPAPVTRTLEVTADGATWTFALPPGLMEAPRPNPRP